MYQFPEQTPYMMPYGMDYPLHGAEISPEMYPSSLHHLAMAGGGQQPGHPGHPGLESLSAESHLHSAQVSSDGSNNTQVLAALGGLGGLGHKIKREDSWMAKSKCKLIQLLDFPDRGGRVGAPRLPISSRFFRLSMAQVNSLNAVAVAAAAAEGAIEDDYDDEE